jgi:N-acylglucosamine 2-epimerase
VFGSGGSTLAEGVDRKSGLGYFIAMSGNPDLYIEECRALYRRTLLDDVVPFWMRHGFDREHGGISNVLDDAGQAVNFDKYTWSQGRALWTFAALVNRVEKRPEWLAFARHIFKYLEEHGPDEQGRWMFRRDGEGRILDRDLSIYADGFAMAGLGEFFAATGEPRAKALALDTAESILQRLERPGSYGVAPYVIPAGMKTHGIAMIFSFFFYNLGEALDEPVLCEKGLALGQEILDDFYDPKHDAIMEFVREDGQPDSSAPARTCVMGHGLEGLWFLLSLSERSGRTERIPLICRLIRRHLELAWDEEYGGLLLARDMEGSSPCFWQKADCKAWWVHAEALVATAYAHRLTGEAWCLEWHKRIRDYAFSHYPVATGEWTQWLDRQGRPMSSAALPVKDPFHLPRALMQLIDLLGPGGGA